MRKHWILAAAAIGTLAACSKTENGDVVVKRPTSVNTTEDTLHMPTFGTRTDTVNTPVVGAQTETVVVKKPVVGTKKTVVRVPTVKQP